MKSEPSLFSMLPFAGLLLAVAFAPLLALERWHRNAAKICTAFALLTASYYVFGLRYPERVLHAALEYGSFIVVVGAFFVVAAGIHVQARGPATPAVNTGFLVAGSLLANLFGTVGASMLLIRPWIALNRNRQAVFHVPFFIFVVSNIGGVLLPIGPPLLLGYLKGVPFFWVAQRCWAPWAVTLGAVLLVFYIFDSLNYRRQQRGTPSSADTLSREKWQFIGGANLAAMAAMLGCLITAPAGWRELFLIVIAIGTYWFTPSEILHRNEFTFAPMREIAWIFLGIFITMIPVLDYMERHAADLGLRSDMQFYWATGVFSAVLDNAPAYLTFLAGALGLHGLRLDDGQQMADFLARHDRSLVAISLGATCFGALTYIGNAPNLLVKAIADHARLKTPSFLGYIFKFAVPVLIPIFLFVSLLFFG